MVVESHFENFRGRRVFVDASDERARRLQTARGDFNPGSRRLWQKILTSRPWDTVVDVGANYGEMIVGVELPAGARLIAFEPVDEIADLLSKTTEHAGLQVEVERLALSDHAGRASFHRDVTWSGKSSLVAVDPRDKYVELEVSTTTLSAYFAGTSTGATCVKIDVEGHELAVLEGARDLVSGLECCALMIEVLHLKDSEVLGLLEEWQVALLDRRLDRLVRLPADPALAEAVLGSGWTYRQDAVLVPRGRPAPWAEEEELALPVGMLVAIAAREQEIHRLEKELAGRAESLRTAQAELEAVKAEGARELALIRKRLRRTRLEAARVREQLAVKEGASGGVKRRLLRLYRLATRRFRRLFRRDR